LESNVGHYHAYGEITNTNTNANAITNTNLKAITNTNANTDTNRNTHTNNHRCGEPPPLHGETNADFGRTLWCYTYHSL
jgi:hypothetical protein